MKKEFKIPNLGENISSAEVVKLLVSIGDKLEKEQPVVEISSDKANIEVPSDVTGIIKEILVKEGDSVKEGQIILTVESEEAEAPVKEKKKPAETAEDKVGKEPEAQKHEQKVIVKKGINKFLLPNLGENISSAEVVKVLVSVGDNLAKDQPVVEISSDKANIEVPSDISGVIKEILVKEGDSVKEGQVILTVEGDIADNKGLKSLAQQDTAEQTKETPKTDVKPVSEDVKEINKEKTIEFSKLKKSGMLAPAAPSVRRFAREIGIDINRVNGTGSGGRISVDDVKAFSKELNTKASESSNAISTGRYAEPLPDFSKWGEVNREAMNNVRFKTAQHLGYAWATIPHVTNFEKVDITDLEKLRKAYSKKVEVAGGKLTFTVILMKILAIALKNFPKFNASIDLDKKEIIYKNYYHIGIAVDTDRGLLVPVVHDADQKNVTQLSIELNQLAEKARNKKLTIEEMQGATFTISNLGGIGGTNFTPIINSPEVAILGVSKSTYEPVYIEEHFVPRLMMPLSLSYDHRLIDGADAARFMKWLKEAIENPFVLLLDG